jgi:hypothetical protein
MRASRLLVPLFAAGAALWAGCTCCSYDPPYTSAVTGDIVSFEEFTPPLSCDRSPCRLVLDVVNSNREVVDLLWEGDPEVDAVPDPVTWDTSGMPADVYVMRARLNHERIDSWVVLLEDRL